MTIRQEDITFHTEDASISGTLSLPSATGIYPAVAVVDGAGPTTRDDGVNPALSAHLAKAGIAVLCWDKPGVGRSSGDWTQQFIEDRAQEALAAIRSIQGHAEVDSNRVGLFEFSQGGWAASLATLVFSAGGYIPRVVVSVSVHVERSKATNVNS